MTPIQTQVPEVKIIISLRTPIYVRMWDIAKAVTKIAEAAGYEFISRTIHGYGENKYHEIYLFKSINETVFIFVRRKEVQVDIHINKERKIFIIDPECFEGFEYQGSIYQVLWGIAEALGFKEFTTINDDPASEGVEFHGYGKKLQLWNNYEPEDNEWRPYEVEVIIEKGEK